ncbi:MAG TPA: Spy/CpxP family protein refolding chaperone [Usitatibacter sp.]|nr:Spy/CpxP family protein refolding chaperone [Usitatibacter sp.]
MKARTLLATIVAAAALAGTASDAGAQMMGPGGGMMGFFSNGIARGGGMPGAPADMQAVASRWLDGLHAELQLSASQEPAWQAFANAVMAQAAAMQQMRSQMLASPASAAQRAALMQQLMRPRVAAVDAMADSLGTLYAMLGADQRAIMDAEFANQCGGLGLFGS